MTTQEKMNEIEELLLANHNIILHGAPGTGKTYLAKQIAEEMKAECEMVQFHQSYDYTDFVEGLRPAKDKDGKVDGFERKDGVFKAFCRRALNSSGKFVFIIDEINRGEMSKIFGELFYSVDPGYRVKIPIDTENLTTIRTQYANLQDGPNEFDMKLGIEKKDENKDKYGHFFVPDNVYIIGTMNDIDRSVESMDFAMRRRFAFKEITAADSAETMLQNPKAWEKVNSKVSVTTEIMEKAKNRMANLNNTMNGKKFNLNSSFHIGAAYFLKLALYLKNGENSDADIKSAFGKLWKNHIEGVLREYLRGMPNAKELLNGEKGSLHEAFNNEIA